MTKSFLSQHLAWCRHIADPKCWVIELVNDQRNEATSAFRNSLRASEEGSEDATGHHPSSVLVLAAGRGHDRFVNEAVQPAGSGIRLQGHNF